NTGQTCISTNRVYVQEGIAEEFNKRLAEKVSQLTIGNGLDEGTDVGPLIDKNSMEKVAAQVEDAIQHNGKVICGGKVHTADNIDGYFYELSVIIGVIVDMEIAIEVICGSVAAVCICRTEEEA